MNSWSVTLNLLKTVSISGFANGKDTEAKGKIDIPNLSEEHEDLEDVDLEVSLTTKGPESDLLKEMLRKGTGAKKIRETLAAYVTALKTEFATGLILPKKGENGAAAPTTAFTSPSCQTRDVVAVDVHKIVLVN